MVNGLLWSVGVVDFQSIPLCAHIVAHRLKRLGGLTGQQGRRLGIAVNALAYEVVGSEIADFENGVGHDVGHGYKLAVVLLRTDGLFFLAVFAGEYQCSTEQTAGGGHSQN